MDIVGREGSLHKVNRESLVHLLFELYKLHKLTWNVLFALSMKTNWQLTQVE